MATYKYLDKEGAKLILTTAHGWSVSAEAAAKSYADAGLEALPQKIAGTGITYDATDKKLHIKTGTGLAISEEGILSVTGDATVNSVEWGVVKNVPKASKEVWGIAKVGDNISVTDGVISVPKATATVAGVVKVGSGIDVSADGVISVTPADVPVLEALTAAEIQEAIDQATA
jgi:hypothetical protein